MRFGFALLWVLAGYSLLHGEVSLKEVSIVFASPEQGRQIITARDQFISKLSGFDRAARLKTNGSVSLEQFLNHISAQVLSFEPAETNALDRAFQEARSMIGEFNLKWPTTIQVIKTTGLEEGNAAYTRQQAIFIPKHKLGGGKAARIDRLLCHELFHILSRSNPSLKEALYQTIGFNQCAEPRLLPSMVWITNPDAPVNDHYLKGKIKGEEISVVPILLANPPEYDLKKGGEFFNYLSFKLLKVELSADEPPRAVIGAENPVLLDPADLEGFFEQVGRNTNYIIHPEEILAENFVLLVTKEEEVKNPEIIERMRRVLAVHAQVREEIRN